MNEAQQTLPVPRAAPRRGLSPLLYLIPLALLLVLLPFLEEVPGLGILASPFQRIQLTYGLTFGIAALGFNLLLGYTGLLSFGHSAFFGGAAYATGFLVKYLGVSSMELFLVGAVAFNLALAVVIGYVCVRYTRIFFSILTLALSQVLWALALKFFWITNGTDGLRIPSPTLLGGLVHTEDKLTFLATTYYYVLAIFAGCVAVMWVIAHSPFGKALQAIRDNEVRAQFVGVRVRQYRWFAFMISAMFTGIAGALWAPLNGLTTPDILHWPFSGKIVFMAVLGGFKSFAGPILGGIVYNYLETYVIKTTEYWQGLLGIILVVLVLTMPQGIIGIAGWFKRRARES